MRALLELSRIIKNNSKPLNHVGMSRQALLLYDPCSTVYVYAASQQRRICAIKNAVVQSMADKRVTGKQLASEPVSLPVLQSLPAHPFMLGMSCERPHRIYKPRKASGTTQCSHGRSRGIICSHIINHARSAVVLFLQTTSGTLAESSTILALNSH